MTEHKKNFRYDRYSVFAIVFLTLFCIVNFITGLYLFYKSNKIIKNGQITEATITSITTKGNGENLEYIVIIEYNINGIDYSNNLRFYKTGMKVGQTVEIRYLSVNPNIIVHKGSEYFLTVLLTFIGLCSFVFLILITKLNKRNNSFE